MMKRLITAFLIYIISAFLPVGTNDLAKITFICSANAAQELKINSINFDNSDSIIFLGTSGAEDSAEIKITKKQLINPDRIFFDIENAVITFPNKSFSLKNSRLQQLKIAQNSLEPNIVRIVIWNSANYDVNQIKILKFKNNIIIKLNNETPIQPYLTQIYRETSKSAIDYYDKAVIIPEEKTESDEIFQKVQKAFKEDSEELVRPNIEQKQARLKSRFFLDKVKVQNSSLVVSGIGVINLKKPIILTEPSRVVYDLPNTVVAQELRDKEFKLSDNITAKIGQFEHSTARIVIRTEQVNSYIPIYSTNLQSVTIANRNSIAASKYTLNQTKLAYFKEQKINENTNVINVIFSNPVVFSLKKEQDKFKLIIYNLIEFDPSSFNKVALENKNGYEASQISDGIYMITFPAKSNIMVDCYETLNASQIRIVFTKPQVQQSPLIMEEPKTIEKKQTEEQTVTPPLIKQFIMPELKLKKEDLVKDKTKIPKVKKKQTTKDIQAIKKIKNKVIIIDPGHGGNDTGALRNGVLEKDITLSIALKVRNILEEAGLKKVIMTRSTDKTLTLADRVEIANSNSADIYVSIHINSSVKTEIQGIETHYYSEKGYDVAKVVHKKLTENITAEDRGLFKSKFYVINHTEAPAVLLELGFISNEKERNSLLSEKRQNDSAQAIADGIIQYLTEH